MKNETVLEPCEGCERLYDDEVICTHDLGLCPDCQKLGIYVACCGCDAVLNLEVDLVSDVGENGYKCDACHSWANEPFEMDWQGFD